MAAVNVKRTAHWGIIDDAIGKTIAQISGVVTEWNENCQFVTANELNELGTAISQVEYDERYTASCTMQVKASDDITSKDMKSPATLSYNGGTYYVISATLVESNKNFRKIQFKLAASRHVGYGAGKQESNESQTV